MPWRLMLHVYDRTAAVHARGTMAGMVATTLAIGRTFGGKDEQPKVTRLIEKLDQLAHPDEGT